jgi:hypothetical protein
MGRVRSAASAVGRYSGEWTVATFSLHGCQVATGWWGGRGTERSGSADGGSGGARGRQMKPMIASESVILSPLSSDDDADGSGRNRSFGVRSIAPLIG